MFTLLDEYSYQPHNCHTSVGFVMLGLVCSICHYIINSMAFTAVHYKYWLQVVTQTLHTVNELECASTLG